MADIGYARISTVEQESALQLDALRKVGCSKIFEDRVSGAKAERPGLSEALRYVRDGDTLVVWKLDRLGRSLSHLIATVKDLEERGVGFCSVTEAIDTTTAGGRLTFHIFGALAEFERELMLERTLAGLAAANARGRKGGRRPSVSEEKLRKAKSWIEQGLSVPEAAGRVKVGRTALYDALAADRKKTEAA